MVTVVYFYGAQIEWRTLCAGTKRRYEISRYNQKSFVLDYRTKLLNFAYLPPTY